MVDSKVSKQLAPKQQPALLVLQQQQLLLPCSYQNAEMSHP